MVVLILRFNHWLSFLYLSLRFTGADAWRYQTAKEIGGSMYWGKVTKDDHGSMMIMVIRIRMMRMVIMMMMMAKVGNYGGGGAVQKLHPEKALTLAIIKVIIINLVITIIIIIIIIIKELREGLWIDRATRLIIIDFTLYNANINMFCIAKVLLLRWIYLPMSVRPSYF